MKKIKLKINGMHCDSCAALIEAKLKDQPGVIAAKVNYDSQKAVVAFDEQKIQESDIQGVISGLGDYSLSEIEDEEGGKGVKKENSRPNFLVPISIVIAGLIVAGAVVVSGGTDKQTAQVSPSQNDSVVQQPLSADGGTTAIQTFEINKDAHMRGDLNAPITLVEFSDFECPFCQKHYPTLKKILNDFQGKVRLVYKHYPLGFHPNAQKAAEASECASEQGKFWEYHDKLFENSSAGYSLDNFKQWAKELGLNSSQFNNCLDSDKYAQRVQADFKEGTEKGVNGTPATFINGQLVVGAQPYETFKQLIDDLLNEKF